MLEAGVEMCLFLELDDHLKVGVVYVRIHPEEAFEDRLDNVKEVGRERSSCSASATQMVIGQAKIRSQTQVVQFPVCCTLRRRTN